MANKTSIPMVKVVYNSSNVAKHSVTGTEKLLGSRSISYGFHKNGDVFNVAEADVAARPELFLAYPCGEPFTVKDGKIVNPCGKVESKEVVGGNLEDIPGIGPRLAQKFIDVGLDTQEKIASQVTPDLLKELSVPPMSREKILEWQDSQLP